MKAIAISGVLVLAGCAGADYVEQTTARVTSAERAVWHDRGELRELTEAERAAVNGGFGSIGRAFSAPSFRAPMGARGFVLSPSMRRALVSAARRGGF